MSELDFNLDGMSREQKLELLAALEEQQDRTIHNKIADVFPEEGQLSRHNYKKHSAFLAAGKDFMERAFIGGNRSGKSFCAATEVVYHTTGEYPEWWQGRTFGTHVKVWVISKDNKQSREAAQEILLGSPGNFGTGLIPKGSLTKTTTKPGVPGAIEDIFVQHKSGQISQITFKSCEQKMDSFMGAAVHVAWFDEEPRRDIYGEVMMRLVTTGGVAMSTFTPLDGFTDVVKGFLDENKFPSLDWCYKNHKYVINVEWDDAPHLSEKQKREYERAIPPYMKDARMKGLPAVGEGRIYQTPESEFVMTPFEVPEHWPRCYALDVGWHYTAAVFGARDPETKTWYIYDEYYSGHKKPHEHALAIALKCGWPIPGLIDPASNRTKEDDGIRLAELYSEAGLNLRPAKNSILTGINLIDTDLSAGKLKVFSNCFNLLCEYHLYKWDKNSDQGLKPAPHQQDHALDALRYLRLTGEFYMEARPDPDAWREESSSDSNDMNSITGY